METRDVSKYRDYVKLRNQVRNECRKAHISHEKNIADTVKEKPKHFWDYVRSKSKVKSGIANLEMEPKTDEKEARMTSNDTEKAETLSNFFSSVFTTDTITDLPILDKLNIREHLEEIKITEDSVRKYLENLNTAKSPGPDNLHPRVLREISRSIYKPFYEIYTQSLRDRVLPEEWKHGKISAIFKKGKPLYASNYRPVSLTSIACKGLKSLVRDVITRHLRRTICYHHPNLDS